jgi:hypothetical protein
MSEPAGSEGYERCGAKKKRGGGPCKLPAGHGTDHVGIGKCRRHGGNTPNHQASAEKVMAEREAARFGLDMTEISGGKALLREVCRSAAMVDWLACQVAVLDPESMVWGVAGRRIIPASTADGQPSVQVEQRARIHPWVIMLRDERLVLTRVAEAAHRCGIEDRMMRQVELEGALIAKFAQALMNDPEWEMRPDQVARISTIVPRHLRAMDGGLAS